MVEKVIRTVILFFINIAVSKYLGANDYGLFASAQAFAYLSLFIVYLGLQNVVPTFLVRFAKAKSSIVYHAILLHTIGFLVYIIINFAIAPYFSSSTDEQSLLLIIVLSNFFIIPLPVESYYKDQAKGKPIAIIYLIQVLIGSAAKFYGITQQFPVSYFAIVLCLEGLVLFAGLWLLAPSKRTSIGIKNRVSKSVLSKIITVALPLILSSVLVTIYNRVDLYMIKTMIGNTEAGYYGIAVKLSESVLFLAPLITSSLITFLFDSNTANEKKIHRLRIFIAGMFVIPLLAGFGILLIGHMLLSFYLIEYQPAIPILNIYVWSSIAAFLGTSVGPILVYTKKQKLSMLATSTGVVLNLVLNFILIPRYGGVGAAWATLVSYSFTLLPYLNIYSGIFKGDILDKGKD
jgi:O-antigen/teichoic acid export membrane protein